MDRSFQEEKGIVAILDALGAASYSHEEVERFLASRDIVLALLAEKVDGVLGDYANRVTTFIFNDTVILILRCYQDEPALEDIQSLFAIVRKFLVDSMRHQILFRGSIAVGSFYLVEDVNTVMGQAVTDAAAWYDKSDWIGIHATPRTSILIDRLLENVPPQAKKDYLMTDYAVPVKDGTPVQAKAVNWPKIFFLPKMFPGIEGAERKKLLELLSSHRIPRGTESKYRNTIAFFDAVAPKKKEGRRSVDKKAS